MAAKETNLTLIGIYDKSKLAVKLILYTVPQSTFFEPAVFFFSVFF